MTSKPIYVVGSANADLVFFAPSLPRPGETLFGRSFKILPGGKGANQAVAAAKLGSDVHFVGAVGRDANGDMLEAALRSAGVDTTLLLRVEEATGCACIQVDDAGMNSIIVVPGANKGFESCAVPPGSVVLAQLEIRMDAVLAAARSAMK